VLAALHSGENPRILPVVVHAYLLLFLGQWFIRLGVLSDVQERFQHRVEHRFDITPLLLIFAGLALMDVEERVNGDTQPPLVASLARAILSRVTSVGSPFLDTCFVFVTVRVAPAAVLDAGLAKARTPVRLNAHFVRATIHILPAKIFVASRPLRIGVVAELAGRAVAVRPAATMAK